MDYSSNQRVAWADDADAESDKHLHIIRRDKAVIVWHLVVEHWLEVELGSIPPIPV